MAREDHLVGRIADGSPEAFRELYEGLAREVFELLLRMTDDRDLAEDLTHDVFLLVHARAHQCRGAGEARGWIFRIAGNLARERGRTRVRRREILRQNSRPEVPARPVDLNDVLDVRRAVERLDEASRLVVMLHAVEGFSHREIAAALDIAEGTSRSRLSRALAQLREHLGASMETAEQGEGHERSGARAQDTARLP